jgi:predicted aldo/keto reductase-like oxidoreductase
MQFRKFGRLDWEVSSLGFGCMRLPARDGSWSMMSSDVDEPEAIRMIRHAIEQGVNYVDSAYPYHLGKSEVVLGKALKGGYRERVKLATKSPVWALRKAEDFDTYLNEQLERLQEEHVDFYLFHGLGSRRWRNILDLDILSRAESAVSDGRVGHIGFSFHDDFDSFKEIIDGYDGWTVCLIQHNYMDTENQAGTRGLRYAASKGLAVAIMEPLLGGCLARPPEDVQHLFDEFEERRSPADWALQWLWNQPEVSVVLSGMSSMKQVEENLRSANASSVGSLGVAESRLIDRVREKFWGRAVIPCTKCGYCLPCDSQVDIPGNFELYNDGVMYGDWTASRFRYMRMSGDAGRAEDCTQCRECEEKCPQDIPIAEWMTRVHAALGERKQ